MDGRTDGQTDRQGDSYIPPQTSFAGGIKRVPGRFALFTSSPWDVLPSRQCFRRSVGPADISGKNRVGQIKFRNAPEKNVRENFKDEKGMLRELVMQKVILD